VHELPDFSLFADLPGAGRVFSARLLAAFGEQRDRFTDASAFQKYTGIAPVTERSGNKHWVHWRWSCPTFLRQTFVEWVASSVPHSFWARAFYESHRAKGASHNATIRALAFKWIRILFRCWVDRTPYNESRYLAPFRNVSPRSSSSPPRPLHNSLAVRLRARVGRCYAARGRGPAFLPLIAASARTSLSKDCDTTRSFAMSISRVAAS
jgi:Transposase IS116/IS110/IS902 family